MRRLFSNLTFQVLFAISLGVLLGLFAPGAAKAMKPVGDTFVNLVKMIITPVIAQFQRQRNPHRDVFVIALT